MSHLTEPIKTSPNAPMLEKIERDPQYYVPGGDIIFLAGSKLFRVHRYFFERESEFFRNLLDIPNPMPAGQVHKGMADANPIGLDDANELDFAKFLWVFYNPSYSEWDAPLETWAPITRLAHIWGFANVKALCIRQLEKLVIPTVDKIVLYRAYDIDQKLLIPAFAAICQRDVALSHDEGKRLGLELALSIAQARERARAAAAGNRVSSPVSLTNTELDEMIIEVLRLNEPATQASDASGSPSDTDSKTAAGASDGGGTSNGLDKSTAVNGNGSRGAGGNQNKNNQPKGWGK